jgi:hypothetical protein
VVPSGGQPLLVLRARLRADEASRLGAVLQAGELASAAGRIGNHDVFRLRQQSVATGPGQDVDLALVGSDLLVANDSTAMREVLAPAPARTAASSSRRVLATDGGYRALSQRAATGPGALRVYVDWRRLRDRLQASVDGVPGALLRSSGLDAAHAVMATVTAAAATPGATGSTPGQPATGPAAGAPAANGAAGFTATLLLDFPGEAGSAALGGGRPGVPRPVPFDRPHPELAPDGGWLRTLRPLPVRALLGELPAGGVGGLVLSIDLQAAAARSHEVGHLLHDLAHEFEHYGLDFERNVISRLGAHGTMQLQVGRAADAAVELRAIYAVRGKSKKAAAELFADLRRVVESSGLGRIRLHGAGRDASGRERRGTELLELASRGDRGEGRVRVALVDDALWLSSDADSLADAVDEQRMAKPRLRRDATAQAVAQSLGGEVVAGLFDVDLGALFEQVAGVFAASGARLDLSGLPRRHVGSLDLQPHDGGTVLRFRVVSSR